VFTVGPDGHVTAIASVREAIDGIGTISRLRDPVIADDGSLVLSAVVAGVGPGLYVYRAGVFSPLARLGDATTADTGDARFRFVAASVTNTAESAVYLGERDAIFQTTPDGSVLALAYTGRPGPLGGIMAQLGSPVADGRGNVYFGADFQGARFNEALLVASSTGVEALVTPDRRLLGGGGIRELFASSIDTLGRPASGVAPGVVFTAALQGATAAEGIFRATSTNRVRTLARVGQRAGSHRLAALGTPSVGPGGAIAFLAAVGRDDRRTAIVAGGTGLEVVAIANAPTRTRVGGKYGELGPPAIGRRGAVFRATLRDTSTEAIFVGRGGRVGVVAATDDTTSSGGRLRSFDDPLAVGEEVWFLARIAGNIAPSGLYRAHLGKIPGRLDPPVEIEPVLLPGDPAPAAIGGVIVTLDAPRVGPSGTITIVAGIGGGTATSAILQFVPGVP